MKIKNWITYIILVYILLRNNYNNAPIVCGDITLPGESEGGGVLTGGGRLVGLAYDVVTKRAMNKIAIKLKRNFIFGFVYKHLT